MNNLVFWQYPKNVLLLALKFNINQYFSKNIIEEGFSSNFRALPFRILELKIELPYVLFSVQTFEISNVESGAGKVQLSSNL